MEGQSSSVEPFTGDEVYSRAREILDSGQSQGRPLYEAATEVASREGELRRLALNARDESDETMPLDPVIFPENTFNPDGSRKTYSDGSPMLTDAEARVAFEREDARGM